LKRYFEMATKAVQYKATPGLIRWNEAHPAKKRWLIRPKGRTVDPCPKLRDSRCCTSMQAADHDHALAA
jgi:hypothetical protein